MTLFIVISFLMNIIALTVVFYLYKQVQLLNDQNINNFTEITEEFLEDIRRENDQLQASVLSYPSQKTLKPNHPINPQNIVAKQMVDKIDTNINSNDQIETSLQANVLQMHNQGVSVGEIAKRLNCGTTEAALIIKFYEDKLP